MNGILFPPESVHRSEIEALVGMLASTTSGRTAVYVATPMTSGHRFVDWFSQRGEGVNPGTSAYATAHRQHVIAPNCAAAAVEIARLRSRFSSVVIDPTAVDLPGWRQADYHVLWATVIERYAGTVVFLDGWEYSMGCVYEFLTALRSGSQLLTADLTPLARVEGVRVILQAVATMRERGISTEFHEVILSELSDIGVMG